MLYQVHLACAGFDLTTLVVIGMNCFRFLMLCSLLPILNMNFVFGTLNILISLILTTLIPYSPFMITDFEHTKRKILIYILFLAKS